MTAFEFDHQERLHLSLLSSEKIIVELKTVSTLRCNAQECLSFISPFRSDLLKLLQDFPSLGKLEWGYSSQSSDTLTSAPRRSAPSGVSLKADFEQDDDGDSGDTSTLRRLVERLQGDRLLVAPMESVFQKRLHRQYNATFAHLPMDGTLVTAEAMRTYLPECGLWTAASAGAWSGFLQGTAPRMAHAPRSLWMQLSKKCTDDQGCEITLTQGVQYGRLWSASSLSLRDVLPGAGPVLNCPWSKERTLQVSRPKTLSPTITTDEIASEDIGTLRITSHVLPTRLAKPFLRMETTSSWAEVSYGRIDRTIHRSNGLAYTGSFETTVTNNDHYEARISLYDILPSYVRPMSIHFSSEAERTYRSLFDSSMLLQHDFVLPPFTSVRLTVDYDPVLLPFEHFPPDPNRGIEVPPSWAVWNASDTLYSQSLLLLPPVPDMSMPFNVISLTCTLYAFVIGSIVNVLVRRAEDKIYYQMYPEKKPKSAKDKIKEKLQRLKEKLTGRKEKIEQEDKVGEEDTWTPDALLQEDGSSSPYLLTQEQRQSLAQNALPAAIRGRSWKRLYSLDRDGDAFETFLSKVKEDDSTILVIKTNDGHIFGGYADQLWARQESYYGSGQAFLFAAVDDSTTTVYKWTTKNQMVQHVDGDKRRLVMGGGGCGFGLCVEDDFRRGSTAPCETFDNEPLCPRESFQVLSFEVYGFIRGSF